MDIFNRKRVEELEMEREELLKDVESLKSENSDLRVCLDKAISDLKHILSAKQDIPEDCTPGPWCKECAFGKSWASGYYVTSRYYHRHYHTGYDSICSGYLCGKGKSCKNFIQKKVEEN